jgi:hypothetical protein
MATRDNYLSPARQEEWDYVFDHLSSNLEAFRLYHGLEDGALAVLLERLLWAYAGGRVELAEDDVPEEIIPIADDEGGGQ